MSIQFFSAFFAVSLSLLSCGGSGGGSTTPSITSTPAMSSSSAASVTSSTSTTSAAAASSASSSLASSVSSSVAALALCTKLSTPDNGDGSGTETGAACRLRTGFDITGAMGLGWNLGNTMDASSCPSGLSDETCWGNPVTTQLNLNTLNASGFTTLRLPVSWDDHTASAPDFIINTQWMDRVEEIANYALSKNMYVIVNLHHTNGWETITTANESAAKARLNKLWTQIATRFEKYDHHLIFETMNEPRDLKNISDGKDDDWWGNDNSLFDVVNHLNAAALDTIRATGGNNARRLVMMPGYVAGVDDHQLDAIVMPNDKMIALSAHSYGPYDFALNQGTGSTTIFTNNDKTTIDGIFSRLDTKFMQKGIPVVMGEWGALDKNNLVEREKHATYFAQKAKAVKIPIVYWDNNVVGSMTGENFGLFKRIDNTWYFPTLRTAMKTGWGI